MDIRRDISVDIQGNGYEARISVYMSAPEPCKTRCKLALALRGARIRVFPDRAQYRRQGGLTGPARPCDTLRPYDYPVSPSRPCYYPAGWVLREFTICHIFSTDELFFTDLRRVSTHSKIGRIWIIYFPTLLMFANFKWSKPHKMLQKYYWTHRNCAGRSCMTKCRVEVQKNR